jgi:4-hydroxy-4-methyl-2-oxoglutarate aldolase
MPNPATPPLPEWLSSTLASDASGGEGVLPGWIHALSPAAMVAGRVLVVAVATDDNKAMRELPSSVDPGTVLVVAGAAESRTAILGDLIARDLLLSGVVAMVTDGLIRDSREVADVGLWVWARGVTPIASSKDGPGSVGGSVTIAGTLVHDGDVVVADADGVVVWPGGEVAQLVEAADARRRSDDERLARLIAAAQERNA